MAFYVELKSITFGFVRLFEYSIQTQIQLNLDNIGLSVDQSSPAVLKKSLLSQSWIVTFLNVVVWQCAAILELFASEDQTLLIRRDT